MNDIAKQRLIEIAASGDRELLADTRRLKALLMDRCGELRTEINLLTMAQQEGVVDGLTKSVASPNVRRVWTLELQSRLGLTEQAAGWAVDSWAEALGIPASASSAEAAAPSSAATPLPQPAIAPPAPGSAGRRNVRIAATLAIAAAIVAAGLYAVNGFRGSADAPPAETASVPAPASPSSTSASAASADAPAVESPRPFAEADLLAAHPDRIRIGGATVAFERAVYEIVLSGIPGDDDGSTFGGAMYVSAFAFDAENGMWEESWSSEELTTDYVPTRAEPSRPIGSVRTIHPPGAGVAAVVFDITTSGSSGMNAIHALTIDAQGSARWAPGSDDDGMADSGLLLEQESDGTVVTDSYDGAQLRMSVDVSVDGNRFVTERRPRSETYPAGSIPLAVELGPDGAWRMSESDTVTLRVGDTFVFAPADDRSKAAFDDFGRLTIYRDPTLASFSHMRHSYDKLEEAGTMRYYLNDNDTPTLTIEVVDG